MQCRHCGKKISLLRRLNDAEFCSETHRASFLDLERAVALARLRENGSKYALSEMPTQPAAGLKQDKKKARGKDEIPAPLAGILTEPERRPKAKRKVISGPRMLGWTLIQELPEPAFSIQARHMELASDVPLEPQPARAQHAVQLAPAVIVEEAAGGGDEPVGPELAPMLGIANPLPARGASNRAAGVAAWIDEPACQGLVRLCHVLGTAQPVESPLARLAVSEPVRAGMAMARLAADPDFGCREWTGGPVSPVTDEMRPDLLLALEPAVETADVPEPVAAAAAESVCEPGMAPLERLELPGPVMAISLATREISRLIEAPAPGLPRFTWSLPDRTIRRGVSMLHLDLSAGSSPPPQSRSESRAMRTRRRLVGPRVRPMAHRVRAMQEAPLLGLAAGEPLQLGFVWLQLPGILPLTQPGVEARIPARGELARSVDPPRIEELYGLALGQGPASRASARTIEAAAVWPLAAQEMPAALLRIEGELAVVRAQPVDIEPEAQAVAPQMDEAVTSEPVVPTAPEPETAAVAVPAGPPMIERLIPLFASRGLAHRRIPEWCEPADQGACWTENLARMPLLRPLRMVPDHADGSGAREADFKPAKAKRPWLSVRLPSLPIASWRAAPADLKWIALALPVILVLALYSFLPTRSKNRVETAEAGISQPSMLSQRFETIRTSIMQRAGVKMADDFRAGLGSWQGDNGWAQSWTYTDASFVSPGQLALYRPSVGMRDYVFAFLGQIDRRSMNWVVRARDERNYVAMRIVMTRSGPLPAASLVRYAVVDGKQDRQTTLPLPVAFRDGTMQQVEVTVSGDRITTRLMGQVVDSFSEPRLETGGVGFYSPKGDKWLLRWVSITHQYDYVGRLCAFLAPYNVSQEARRME